MMLSPLLLLYLPFWQRLLVPMRPCCRCSELAPAGCHYPVPACKKRVSYCTGSFNSNSSSQQQCTLMITDSSSAAARRVLFSLSLVRQRRILVRWSFSARAGLVPGLLAPSVVLVAMRSVSKA